MAVEEASQPGPLLSVIIPTYNRSALLRDTLQALAAQTLPAEQFEVIVVDDGSTENLDTVVRETYPFSLVCLRQPNQGDAAARNLGVRYSHGEIIVFLDDDVLVQPGFLTAMLQEQGGTPGCIVAGYLLPAVHEHQTVFARVHHKAKEPPAMELSFADVSSNCMCLRRSDFYEIGDMDSFGFLGSSLWCDVDFNYRAFLRGCHFRQAAGAMGVHRDYVLANVDVATQRMEKVSQRAAILFRKHPSLPPYLPMFRDKLPVDWRRDPPHLVLKKAARALSARPASMAALRWAVSRQERGSPDSPWLPRLYNWLIGAHMWHGLRAGLDETAPLPAKQVQVIR